jgi:hypothetical protein
MLTMLLIFALVKDGLPALVLEILISMTRTVLEGQLKQMILFNDSLSSIRLPLVPIDAAFLPGENLHGSSKKTSIGIFPPDQKAFTIGDYNHCQKDGRRSF